MPGAEKLFLYFLGLDRYKTCKLPLTLIGITVMSQWKHHINTVKVEVNVQVAFKFI